MNKFERLFQCYNLINIPWQNITKEIEETHVLFKDLIKRNRPALDVDAVATGEHWYGQQCVDLGLIDVIQTSDDYLYDASQSSDIFEVSYEVKKSMADRLGFAMEGALTRSVTRLMGILQSRGKHLV